MDKKSIQLQSASISYYQSAGVGQTYLLVHGNSMSGLQFYSQLNSDFAQQNNVIAIELPGHGYSSRQTDSEYTIDSYATTLVEFITNLQLTNFILVGSSLGGHVVMHALAKLKHMPHAIVKGAVVSGAVPLEHPFNPECLLPTADPSIFMQREFPTTSAMQLAADNFITNELDLKNLLTSVELSDGKVREELVPGVLAKANYENEPEILANNTTPLAFIMGERDNFFSIPYLQTAVEPYLSENSFYVIVGGGHLVNISHPRQFEQALQHFANGI